MENINENIAAHSVKENAKTSDEILLRQAIIAEYDAVNLYEQMAESTNNATLKEILLHVAQEEKEHIGEFEFLLEKLDKEHKKSVRSGKSEVKEYTGFKEWYDNKKDS